MKALTICLLVCCLPGLLYAGGIIIDHTYTDLSSIPLATIQQIQDQIKVHYAHTSHGGQITVGLERIANSNSTYEVAIGYCYLPNEAGALCVFDGQETHDYITPEEYWGSAAGRQLTRDVLQHNPVINTSMFGWCCQMDYYSTAEVDAYLAAMNDFESEFPDVTFVYFTGNAQASGYDGYNRYLNNQRIRQYCQQHDKVLFDFADLDAWWFNPTSQSWEHATYQYNNMTVPIEHPQFNGDQAAHTTYTSCEQKGRAYWWLLAELLSGTDTVPVYRFFNTRSGGHLYTTSRTERDYIINHLPHYTYEGPKFRVYDQPQSETVPVYRFFNTRTGIHLYTISQVERDYILAHLPHYSYEGVKFHVYAYMAGNTTPMYRFFNTRTGGHLYTISQTERDYIIGHLPHYNYEGIKFYVFP